MIKYNFIVINSRESRCSFSTSMTWRSASHVTEGVPGIRADRAFLPGARCQMTNAFMQLRCQSSTLMCKPFQFCNLQTDKQLCYYKYVKETWEEFLIKYLRVRFDRNSRLKSDSLARQFFEISKCLIFIFIKNHKRREIFKGDARPIKTIGKSRLTHFVKGRGNIL